MKSTLFCVGPLLRSPPRERGGVNVNSNPKARSSAVEEPVRRLEEVRGLVERAIGLLRSDLEAYERAVKSGTPGSVAATWIRGRLSQS